MCLGQFLTLFQAVLSDLCGSYVVRLRGAWYLLCYIGHVLLHAALQHAATRRGVAAYGDAYLLFGRPKMLISAYPFAPSLLVS